MLICLASVIKRKILKFISDSTTMHIRMNMPHITTQI